MKRNWITGSFVLCTMFMANQALASDGVVHFTGEVIDSTCEVTTDTIGQTVALGKVNKSAFTTVGTTAAPTEFSIKLDKCPATYTQAAARFDGTEASDGNGDLAIGTPVTAATPGDYTGDGTAAAATGVAIRIYNRTDNSQVKLYKDSSYTTIDSGKAELKFIARYIATSASVTPGTANADSQFTIEYMK